MNRKLEPIKVPHLAISLQPYAFPTISTLQLALVNVGTHTPDVGPKLFMYFGSMLKRNYDKRKQ